MRGLILTNRLYAIIVILFTIASRKLIRSYVVNVQHICSTVAARMTTIHIHIRSASYRCLPVECRHANDTTIRARVNNAVHRSTPYLLYIPRIWKLLKYVYRNYCHNVPVLYMCRDSSSDWRFRLALAMYNNRYIYDIDISI